MHGKINKIPLFFISSILRRKRQKIQRNRTIPIDLTIHFAQARTFAAKTKHISPLQWPEQHVLSIAYFKLIILCLDVCLLELFVSYEIMKLKRRWVEINPKSKIKKWIKIQSKENHT